MPPTTVYRDGYHDGTGPCGWDYSDPGARAYARFLAAERLAWIEAHGDTRSRRLLDVGGGLGEFSAVAAEQGWDAELLEPVPDAAAVATGQGVRAICAGVEDIRTLDRRYGAVCFVHSLEHFADARTVLEDARTVLDGDGLVFIEVPNHASIARRWQGDWWNGWQAGEHVYLFTPPTLRRLVERAGYDVMGMRTTVPLWDGLEEAGFAHMVGLQRALYASVTLKRRLARAVVPGRRALRADQERPPVPDGAAPANSVEVAGQSGFRGLLFRRGLRTLATLQESLGLGTNIQLLARPADRS